MKARDTVINRREIDRHWKDVPEGTVVFGFEERYIDWEECLRLQAEISFKAGYKEGHIKGIDDATSTLGTFGKGKEVGIRTVVGWIEPHLQNLGSRDFKLDMWITISERDWQAQKKEWGYELPG